MTGEPISNTILCGKAQAAIEAALQKALTVHVYSPFDESDLPPAVSVTGSLGCYKVQHSTWGHIGTLASFAAAMSEVEDACYLRRD